MKHVCTVGTQLLYIATHFTYNLTVSIFLLFNKISVACVIPRHHYIQHFYSMPMSIPFFLVARVQAFLCSSQTCTITTS
ncbi:hypothetical protein BKA67DRAFT_19280 [Truncatella angustata]|uniref:Uncharacterized protein n=1 Tax=Truncatella angustata TaxID=152316 RepID=A0A9P8UWB7_9PEZI|nr:uncharacterized protein BKA67DRAFT_19280 [Truncatella angustata]KAH6659593.1 hypothetical protein BKA67DRAFT_19280 [Truncatella angustata]